MNAFDMTTALKVIGNVMKANGITHEQLRAQFPDRPTNEQEAGAVASWLGEQIAKKSAVAQDGKPEWAKPKAAPVPPAPSSPQVNLPENTDKNGKPKATRYALRGSDGEVKFYRVKAGRKPGFYFVDVQASDDSYPIKNRATKDAILGAIAKDPEAALALYGQEIGACGRCGRTLTSEYRKLGIGPVCIDK